VKSTKPKKPGIAGVIGRRLKEPSTYAGLGALGAVLGIKELADPNVAATIATVGGLVALFLPEG
jgi:hypothetical protein